MYIVGRLIPCTDFIDLKKDPETYSTKDAAEKEAEVLAEKYPDNEFIVFKAVCSYKKEIQYNDVKRVF